MNCWHCKHELIWCSDFDIDHESDSYVMLTNLHCPNCGTDVDVYLPREHTSDQLELSIMEGTKDE